ncbi:MAG: D-2-hydroxyacid dehydrogenase [Desulfovibrio sp.]|jgi:glycerate dehydrogenase|nr:D-2-hydroxyacid dehydrogenase [Desulfovibrio sp.]
MNRRPRLVFLDAATIGGDIPWPDFSSLGEVTLHDFSRPEDIPPRLREADIVLTNKTPLSAGTIASAPALRCIGVLATGYNVVDVAAAAARGIPVCNVPEYSSASVAQHTFALILALCSQICDLSARVREGEWGRGARFSFWHTPLRELAGKVLGVVGFGAIGGRTASLAHQFGMEVLAYAPRPRPVPDYAPFAFVSLEDLFARADIVSLHCPLTPENTGMVDARLLSLMKPTAFLINTARGDLVVEADLAAALRAGRLAGAGLDVVSREPMPDANPLRAEPRCLLTPHVAWATVEARGRLMEIAFNNVKSFLEGRPVNICNGV